MIGRRFKDAIALRRWLVAAALVCAVIFPGHGAAAAEKPLPLHARIDRAIREAYDGPWATRADDAEFLRRVSLDLTGSIPDVETARAFLDNPDTAKREQLIDRLLDSPQYARRMATVFDVMLMERRGGNRIAAAEWQTYLRESFARNKPFNRLASEILAADGARRGPRAAAKFYLDRGGEPHLLTRDVARLFFGMNLQCAQCHDHPLVDGYLQEDYYGIYAFLVRGYIVKDKKLGAEVFAEKAEGDVKYQSVFMPEETHETGPHLPGKPPIAEPQFKKDACYEVAPADQVAAVPKFSRLAELGRLVAGGASEAMTKNIVNRLWALMMGRGLVNPVGWQHDDNPPSHPKLFNLLADDFVRTNFNVKAFLRELALSETYQRSSQLPAGVTVAQVPDDRYSVATLKPLSPEQLAWSMMQATGVTDVRQSSALHKLAGDDPRFFELLEADAPRRAIKASLLENTVHAGLQGQVGSFVNLFTGLPGTPDAYQASVQQALFLSNSPQVQGWLNPASAAGVGSLMAKLNQVEPTGAVADELFLSVFTRRPTDEECDMVGSFLAQHPGEGRAPALKELAWALLTSAEFRFNH